MSHKKKLGLANERSVSLDLLDQPLTFNNRKALKTVEDENDIASSIIDDTYQEEVKDEDETEDELEYD